MRISVFATCAFCLVCSTLLRSQDLTPNPSQIEVGPFGFVRSPVFSLAAGQGLRLSASSSSGVSLDAFVYNATDGELVAKSDDEETEEYYDWRAAERGQYYMVVHNIASVGGAAVITILPKSTRKGPALQANSIIRLVYYATTRQATASNTGKGIRYGTEPADNDGLQYGAAKVSIPRAHRMGELEGPAIWRLEFSENHDKHVVLLSATPEDERSFYKSVAAEIQKSAKQEALVFVHGFNIGFEEATRRTAQIAYDLGFNGPAILFSWPSQGEVGLVAYEKDVRNVDLSASQLMTFLSQCSNFTGAKQIHIIAHSMGNRAVVKALASLSSVPQNRQFHIRHVALMAPDLDATEFRRLALAMKKTAGDVTLYASSRDTALRASQTLAGYPRAGEGGENIVVMPGIIETVDCSMVDTSLLGWGHSYYADSSAILSDLFQLIQGNPARARFRLRMMNSSKGQYWAFVPAVR